MATSDKQPWQILCVEKRAKDASRIPSEWLLDQSPALDQLKNVMHVPRECGLLTMKELEITELNNLTELRDRLKAGVYSSEDVVRAFCKRAAIAHQLTNCLSEFWFEEAIEKAKDLDNIWKQSGPVGPLHGVPISLKDQFQVKGKECNMGWASWIGNISKENSTIVDCVTKAGAVIYTRTNVAQGLWFGEGDNHVYGRTENPFNRDAVSGGSSAGEGPLNALMGSPIGVGSDIAGSIRYPSVMNNLYGLRPTTRRLTYGKALNSLMGFESAESSIGPMCTNLNGCELFMDAVIGTEPWKSDPSVIPIPWRKELLELKHIGGPETKLAFGYYDFDGIAHIHPPIKRAIKITIDALIAQGHEVIPWKPTGHGEAIKLLFELFDADGGDDLQSVVKKTGETYMPQMLVGKNTGKKVFETYLMNRKKTEIRTAMLEKWQSTGIQTSTGRPIDGIICPVANTVAPPHRSNGYAGYTAIFNLLDWPSITLPVTTVDLEVDPKEAGYEAIDDFDQMIKNLYDPVRDQGLPAGVQLVGRRFQEEELLGVSRVVMEALSKK